MIELLRQFVFWLLQEAGAFLHSLAGGWLAWAVLAGLAVLAFAYVRGLDALARLRISRLVGVARDRIDLAPLHAVSGRMILYLGLAHLALYLLSHLAFREGAARHGPGGWLLAAIRLDVLVPTPYVIAVPLGILGFGFLYGLIFLGFASVHVRERRGSGVALEWVKAFFFVLFFPFSFLVELVARLVGGARRAAARRATKKANAERDADDARAARAGKGSEAAKASGGDADGTAQQGAEAPPDSDELAPLTPDELGQPAVLLSDGYEQRKAAGATKVPRFLLMPRYRAWSRPVVRGLLAAVLAALLAPMLLDRRAGETEVPVATDAFERALLDLDGAAATGAELRRFFRVDVLGAPHVAMVPSPFFYDPATPGRAVNAALGAGAGVVADVTGAPALTPDHLPDMAQRITPVDPLGAEGYYACTESTFRWFWEFAHAQPDAVLRAKALLNAGVCYRGLFPAKLRASELLRMAWNQILAVKDAVLAQGSIWLPDVLGAVLNQLLEGLQLTEQVLWEVREAARDLSGDPQLAAQAYLLAALAHEFPGRDRERFSLLRSALETSGAQPEAALAALFRETNLLVRLARYRDALGLWDRFAEQSDQPGEQRWRRAVAAFVAVNRAAVQIAARQKGDAAETLAAVIALEGRPGEPQPLVAAAKTLAANLRDDRSNGLMELEIARFGAVPAGFLAALLLYLLALRRTFRSKEAERPTDKEAPRSAPLPEVAPEADEADIVAALQRYFLVEQPPIPHRGAPDDTLAEALRDAAAAIDEAGRRKMDARAARRSAEEASNDLRVAAGVQGARERGEEPEDVLAGHDPLRRFLSYALDQHGYAVARAEDQQAFVEGRRPPAPYPHQSAVLVRLAAARKEPGFSTIVLSVPDGAGKTTAALGAAMDVVLQHGGAVLYLCRDAAAARDRGHLFQRLGEKDKEQEWAWNLRAAVGAEGIDESVREGLPVHVLFAEPGVVQARVLPLEDQAKLHHFLRCIHLVVVEDVDACTTAAIAHTSFILRRLAEVLRSLDIRPTTLVTMKPVVAHEDQFVRELVGPLAEHLHTIPASADVADSLKLRHYPVRLRREMRDEPHRSALQGCPPEHVIAAIVQAKGVVRVEAGTSWPTILVGMERQSPARDDRALRFCAELGVPQLIELAPRIREARASVFPISARTVPELDACLRHAGFEAARPAEDEGSVVSYNRREAHTTFLLEGPEPVDAWLRMRLRGVVEMAGAADAFLDLLAELRPEWVVPRRNRIMNTYHFRCALQERAAPGQRVEFLEDTFEMDVLEQMIEEAARLGRFSTTRDPMIDREASFLAWRYRAWGPRLPGHDDRLVLDAYSPDLVRVTDRLSRRHVASVERERARIVYHPGRVFVSGGVRMTVLPPHHQTAWSRGELVCEPLPTPVRSSRVRGVQFRPSEGLAGIPALEHALGRGAPFLVGFSRVRYAETVGGVRKFPSHGTKVLSRELFEPQTEEFDTEALVLGFDERSLPEQGEPRAPGAADPVRAILLSTVLMLRQTLPLVLRASDDDIEVAWGTGERCHPKGYVTESCPARFDLGRETPQDRPWIAIIDRMAHGLGYARLIQQRLFQGTLVREWLETALRLGRWSMEREDADAPTAVQTSLWYELEDSPPADGDRLGVRFLERLLGEAAAGGGAAGADDDDEIARQRARRGLTDLFGLREVERELAELLLPEWQAAGDSTWALAFLCVLWGALPDPDPDRRQRLEQAVLRLIARHHEEANAARDRAAAGDEDEEGSPLDGGEPELAVFASRAPASIEEEYGPLARHMRLVDGEPVRLTALGCLLARTLYQAPGFASQLSRLQRVLERNPAAADGLATAGVLRDLGCAELPQATQRVLAAALDGLASTRRVGLAWHREFADRPVPQRFDRPLEQLAARTGESPDDGRLQERLRAALACHRFDRALRRGVNRLRFELGSTPTLVLPVSTLLERDGWQRDQEALGGAAREFLDRCSAVVDLPRDVRTLARSLAGATDARARLALLVAAVETAAAPQPPLRLVPPRLQLAPKWVKKSPDDSSRGLDFGLRSLAAFLRETGWRPDLPPLEELPQDGAPCDLGARVPEAYRAPLPPRASAAARDERTARGPGNPDGAPTPGGEPAADALSPGGAADEAQDGEEPTKSELRPSRAGESVPSRDEPRR